MSCESAREWILNAESPADRGAVPAEIASHVANCSDCRKLIRDITHLETDWRNLPSSPQSKKAKTAFLDRLHNRPVPHAPIVRLGRWKRSLAWATVAALFIVAGAGVLFFWPTEQPVQAQSDVIDQLVDWNLELTEAPTPADRERIFSERHEKLKGRIKQARLNEADHELAENLLANGTWLVKNDDPVEELNRFNRMADRLMEKMQRATDRADASQAERMARQYAKIAERGIDGNLERIKVARVVDPERKLRIKQMLKEDQDRNVMLLILVETGPVNTQKELKKALELSNKRHKVKKQDR